VFAQLLQHLAALAALARQKTVEQEMLVKQAGGGKRRGRRARAGQRNDLAAGGAHGGDNAGAGVGNTRRAGIGNQRHRFAGLQFLDDAGGGFVFVVLVRRQVRAARPAA
jgi:hypothetical protein